MATEVLQTKRTVDDVREDRKPVSRMMPDDEEFNAKLVTKISSFIALADAEEEMRRRSDRIGGNMYYSRHWQVAMPQNRVAMTVNVAKRLIDHKIAIMTKNDPIFVVMPADSGDQQAARMVRAVLQHQWREDGMQLKSRQALRLCNTTRTCAAKTFWDPTKNGGIGGITTDILPGWRILADDRTRDPERMEFAGDRAVMSRVRAMLLYPLAAEYFIDEGTVAASNFIMKGSAETPLQSQWKGLGVDAPAYAGGSGGTLINGKPVITAFTSRSPSSGSSEYEVEIVEMYHRDRTMEWQEVEVKDGDGMPKKRVARDEDGMPVFEQSGPWDHILEEPGYVLKYETLTRDELRPKYPFWRRTTMLMPHAIIIDDRAWDAPLPYDFLNDNEPLDGLWMKGVILDLESLQNNLNVSLSVMLDNLRFSSYRAWKASVGAQIEKNNMVIDPGDIIRVGQDVSQFVPLEFPQVSEAWFGWVNLTISLMEKIVGLEGIMQGSAADAPRTDSAKGFDTLAEIGGSGVVECTQRFESWIAGIGEKVAWYAMRHFTEEHAIAVEDIEGRISWERADAPQLRGDFSFRVSGGSTLAWNASGVRARVLEEMMAGLRDRVSVWKRLDIEDWPEIRERQKADPAGSGLPPPPRTRGPAPKQPRVRGPGSGAK